MSKPFLSPINMNKLEILNHRLHVVAGDASTPVEGQVWYDSTAKRLKFRSDAANIAVLTVGADLAAGSVANTALTTNPLARANHTGTQTAATVSDFDTQVRTSRLDQMAAPTVAVGMNSQKLTSLANGSAASDSAAFGQIQTAIDAAVAGLDWKEAVRVASTANLTLSAAQTIDGVAVVAGDRVLAKDQTTASANGIYIVAAGAWTRSTDADTSADIKDMSVLIAEGTANQGTQWKLTTDAITLGTTALTYVQHGAGGTAYTAGNGLTLTGNDFNVGAGTGISVAADAVAVDTAVVTRKYSADIGNGSLTSIAVTHSLGTRDVQVQVYDKTTFDTVECDQVRTDTNTVTLTFAVAPTAAQYRICVQG